MVEQLFVSQPQINTSLCRSGRPLLRKSCVSKRVLPSFCAHSWQSYRLASLAVQPFAVHSRQINGVFLQERCIFIVLRAQWFSGNSLRQPPHTWWLSCSCTPMNCSEHWMQFCVALSGDSWRNAESWPDAEWCWRFTTPFGVGSFFAVVQNTHRVQHP